MKPCRALAISSATSEVDATSAFRIATARGTGSIVTETVRTTALCIRSGARKVGPTSERGSEETQ